jgi:hypothetical protein
MAAIDSEGEVLDVRLKRRVVAVRRMGNQAASLASER